MREWYSQQLAKKRKWKKDSCNCGAECWFEDGFLGECEGPISVVDEITLGDDDWMWVHTCDKHYENYK